MRIHLIKANLKNDFLFQISDPQNTFLTNIDYSNKVDCLTQLQEVLIDLRNNEQISIQSGNNSQYYFEVANLAQSPSFRHIEAASDVLAKLKAFATDNEDFSITYNQAAEQVVSKKKLSSREESYDFSRVSISNKLGFELIDIENSPNKFFHFNDKEGNALLFSRVLDGNNQRIKAIKSIIKNAKNEERYGLIEQNGQFFFILKTRKGFEIARSKSFASRAKMEQGVAFLNANAGNFNKKFKLSKKKNKKKKTKEKYGLKKSAPLGIIGFEGFKNNKNKHHYFHYHDEEGQALLYSMAYEKRGQRDKAMAYLVKNGSKKKAYKTWKKNKKQYYFSASGNNGKSFARSRYFPIKKEMLSAMEQLKNNVTGFQQEVNVVPIFKEKKYIIHLPKEKVEIPVKISNSITPISPPTEIETPELEMELVTEPEVEKEIISAKTEVIIEETPAIENITAPIITPPAPKPSFKQAQPIHKEIIEDKPSAGFPWKWLFLCLLGIILTGLLVKFCGKTDTPKELPKPEPKVVAPPAKLGPTALELNLTPNTTEARIADFLSSPKVKAPKTFILESVQFPFNSALLTNTSYAQLDNVVTVLKEYPNSKIEVNGHTDSRGEDAKNNILSQNRAKAVQSYLTNNGISISRILKAVGFGERDPIATNDTEKGRQENRRSEIVVIER